MKKLKVILSVLCVATLLVGCVSNTKEQSSTNETKQEEKQEIKREDNGKKEEKEREELRQKLKSLQPDKITETEYAKAFKETPKVKYDDLVRYSEDHKGKQYKITGMVHQVEPIDDGGYILYLTEDITGKEYALGYAANGVNVLEGDGITVVAEFNDVLPVEQTNGFGAKSTITLPALVVDYLYPDSFMKSEYMLGVYIQKNMDGYTIELVDEAKVFADLKDKKGHVFALRNINDGTYFDKYIYGENGDLYFYTPTIDGKNINGEEFILGNKL